MECLGYWDSKLISETFLLTVRDRLLAMMVSACESENITRMVAAFSSCEVLERLVKSFLTWHVNQEDTWIHVPTFCVTEVRVELLAAIVAAGAVKSASRPVQKFGLAVHEKLYIQLRKMVRDLV